MCKNLWNIRTPNLAPWNMYIYRSNVIYNHYLLVYWSSKQITRIFNIFILGLSSNNLSDNCFGGWMLHRISSHEYINISSFSAHFRDQLTFHRTYGWCLIIITENFPGKVNFGRWTQHTSMRFKNSLQNKEHRWEPSFKWQKLLHLPPLHFQSSPALTRLDVLVTRIYIRYTFITFSLSLFTPPLKLCILRLRLNQFYFLLARDVCHYFEFSFL